MDQSHVGPGRPGPGSWYRCRAQRLPFRAIRFNPEHDLPPGVIDLGDAYDEVRYSLDSGPCPHGVLPGDWIIYEGNEPVEVVEPAQFVRLYTVDNLRDEVAALKEEVDQLRSGIGDTDFDRLVRAELAKARATFPPLHSAHEAYGVLAEELAEFFDLVRLRDKDVAKAAMLPELVQIAAMARMTAEDLGLIP